jgi:hypothetical protein
VNDVAGGKLSFMRSHNTAGFAVFAPKVRVDTALGVERGDQRVAFGRISDGMVGLTRKLQLNAPEGHWKFGDRGHQGSPFLNLSARAETLFDLGQATFQPRLRAAPYVESRSFVRNGTRLKVS